MKEIFSLEIVRYDYRLIDNNEPKIVIQMIKALDKDGNYIKFISMKEAEPLLSKLPVRFKPR